MVLCDAFSIFEANACSGIMASARRISFNCANRQSYENTKQSFTQKYKRICTHRGRCRHRQIAIIIILIDVCRYLSNAHLNAYTTHTYMFLLSFYWSYLILNGFSHTYRWDACTIIHHITAEFCVSVFHFIAFDLFKLHLNTLVQRKRKKKRERAQREREKERTRGPYTFNNAIWCLFLLSCCHLTSLFFLWYLYRILYMFFFPLENVSFMFLFESCGIENISFTWASAFALRIIAASQWNHFWKCEHIQRGNGSHTKHVI